MASHNERKAALKQEVEDLIREYATSDAVKPPFTTEELIAIVAVCADAEWMDEKQIHRAIFRTFPYYADQAMSSYIENAVPTADDGWAYNRPYESRAVPNFQNALRSSELPLVIEEHVDATNNARPQPHQASEWLYQADPIACRIYLQNWLESERKGTFDFLGLPPELRNQVYELLLVLPSSGISRHRSNGKERLHVKERDCATTRDDVPKSQAPMRRTRYGMVPSSHEYFLPGIVDRLGLLRTCKQILSEAVAIFYAQNYFILDPPFTRSGVFCELAKSRLKYLSTLQIRFRPDSSNSIVGVVPMLSSINQIKRLELDMGDDDNWLKMRGYERQWIASDRKRAFTRYDQIPNIPEIAAAAARAQTLIIIGGCPKARAYFEAEAVKHKKQTKAQQASQASKTNAKTKVGRTKAMKTAVDPSQSAPIPARRTRRKLTSAAEA